jgi:hypothetical protein
MVEWYWLIAAAALGFALGFAARELLMEHF